MTTSEAPTMSSDGISTSLTFTKPLKGAKATRAEKRYFFFDASSSSSSRRKKKPPRRALWGASSSSEAAGIALPPPMEYPTTAISDFTTRAPNFSHGWWRINARAALIKFAAPSSFTTPGTFEVIGSSGQTKTNPCDAASLGKWSK